MSIIKIVALITVKPEYRATLSAQFTQLVQASRAQAENNTYDLHQDIQNPNRCVFVESWQSQAAVDEHSASEHFQAFVQAIDGKTDDLEIVMLNELSI